MLTMAGAFRGLERLCFLRKAVVVRGAAQRLWVDKKGRGRDGGSRLVEKLPHRSKVSFLIGVAGRELQKSQLKRPTDSNFLLKVCIFYRRLDEGDMKNIYYAARTNNRCWSLLIGTVI
jgi:hypothetical protein